MTAKLLGTCIQDDRKLKQILKVSWKKRKRHTANSSGREEEKIRKLLWNISEWKTYIEAEFPQT